jgi:hypothetical protein
VSKALVAVLFAATATITEIALVVFGIPWVLIIAVSLGFLVTGFLLVDWHPAAILTSVGLYLFAVVIGSVGFYWLELASQAL